MDFKQMNENKLLASRSLRYLLLVFAYFVGSLLSHFGLPEELGGGRTIGAIDLIIPLITLPFAIIFGAIGVIVFFLDFFIHAKKYLDVVTLRAPLSSVLKPLVEFGICIGLICAIVSLWHLIYRRGIAFLDLPRFILTIFLSGFLGFGGMRLILYVMSGFQL